jgi:hypothetical protein
MMYMTYNGKIGDLVSHVMFIECPKCGQKDNFQSTVANRRLDKPDTIRDLNLRL